MSAFNSTDADNHTAVPTAVESHEHMRIDLPSHSDPIVAGSSGAIGGPVGTHANLNRRFWTPLRIVLALTCVALAFCWVQKSPCQEGTWNGFTHFQYETACYTDVFALYGAEGLSNGEVPYLDHAVEYPVLTGFLMGAVGLPVHAASHSAWFMNLLEWLHDRGLVDSAQPNEGMYFYEITALILSLFALLTVWAIARTRRSRPWDAAMMALAPVLVVTAFVNWDLFTVGLTALAICAWGRRMPMLAGVLFGLAVAAKFYPLLILGPLLLLCLRARKMPEFLTTFAVAASTWLAINVPVFLVNPSSWFKFYSFSRERGVDWGTFWYVGMNWPHGDGSDGIGIFRGVAANVDALNEIATVLFLLCCAGIAALALFAPQPPRLGQLGFLIVATFLLTNKVWSQQYVLWLLPLLVLARPKWRAFLLWQACEILYFFGFYQIQLRTSGGDALFPSEAFTYISVVRWLSVALLCGLVVYEILRPQRDIVRTHSTHDPEGGVLNDVLDEATKRGYAAASVESRPKRVVLARLERHRVEPHCLRCGVL